MEYDQAEQILREARELISGQNFRNFVAQAHSRAVLQRLGADPAQWPRYSPELDENLLYTAYFLFWQGLQLKTLPDFRTDGDALIKQGAEILEFLYSEAVTQQPERIEQLFSAALGYYISGYYARSYVLMKELGQSDSLPQELQLLHRLFIKDLIGLRGLISQVLGDETYSDKAIAAAIRGGNITRDEALDRVLRASLNRAFSFFAEFPKNGRRTYIEQARKILDEGIDLTEKIQFVDWWWLFYCAKHLIDEFDANSLWTQLSPLLDDDGGGELVKPYIRTSYRHDPPIVELWRSQVVALPRINDDERHSYCLKMPTSAGKTRVAELAILRFLLDFEDDPDAKCIYVAPFRSLAVEIESSLRQSFHPLGARVSELYGGFELSPIERLLMKQTRIVVATPEKIDAFLRYNPDLAKQIRLVIIDEGHIISPTERGVRFEVFLHRLITRFAKQRVRFLFLSAVLPNVEEFATWITGDSNNVIESDWRPSRLMLGELRWNGKVARIEYTHSGYEPLEYPCFVPSFIQPLEGEQLRGTRRRNPFPHDLKEVVADAALRFAQEDMTLVFVAQKRSAEPFGRELLKAIKIKEIVANRNGETFHLPISEEGRELLKDCISLAKETMGDDADLIKFLKAGFVVHHSALPQQLRIKIEQLVREQVVKLVVATTTVAQGVNFPIRTVIVHSLWHGHHQPLSPLDFWNVCGRAGRGMKENEGQVLFAVHLADKDPTLRADSPKAIQKRGKAIRQQRRAARLRREIIDGYRTYRVLSALRQVLHSIVQQWQRTHAGVDVAELCQVLAENNLDWVSGDERENVAAGLDFLDTQLIALTEELDTEKITPDDLQMLLQRSLLLLQLEAEPQGILTARLANDMLYARLRYIRHRFPLRAQRHKLYILGLPISDCEKIENNKDELLRILITAQDYYRWNAKSRCDFLASLLAYLFDLREFNPDNSSLPQNLKENWQQLWRPVLQLWLLGGTPNEMVKHPDIAAVTSSPTDVSLLIDDLFAYRAPWGLNALSVYLQEVAAESEQKIPVVADYFSALLKYGVHSPAASALLAFGLGSRKIALRLASQCPNEAMEIGELLAWFVQLTKQQLVSFGFNSEETLYIIGTQQEARRIANMRPRQPLSWDISIDVSDQVLGELHEGDALVLKTRPDIGSGFFTLYTLWGHRLGDFEFSGAVPELWSSPERIEVLITGISKRHNIVSIALRITEV